jgi:tRNA(adenine34) deaminase
LYGDPVPGFSFDSPMGEALAEARLSLVDGDVPVGAVVLNPEDRIVGRGHNRREAAHDPTAHAEILALREAAASAKSWRLDGHTLVVTLEPCAMCAGAILQARIPRLVIGAWDEKAGATGSRWDLVRDGRIGAKVEVISGVREAECAALLAGFFESRRD